MEKEFEAIRDDKLRIGLLGLKRLFEANKEKISKDEIMAFDFTFMNITKALTELQAIKEANPSEALILFRGFKEGMITDNAICITKSYFDDKFPIIEKALIKSQEQEKVFEIVFKKQVDINEIKILLANLKHCDDIERCKRYNASRKVGYKLKQEEFELLKRWSEK